jgi:hypothetical protein
MRRLELYTRYTIHELMRRRPKEMNAIAPWREE